MRHFSRPLFIVLGLGALLSGIVGLFLPVIPTTPFIILASWCFARSSPRFHHYLRHHPRFGAALRDWEDHGIISRRGKWISSVMTGISVTAAIIVFGQRQPWAVTTVALICAAVCFWIWRLPES